MGLSTEPFVRGLIPSASRGSASRRSSGLSTPRPPRLSTLRVDHRRAHIRVSRELLHGPDVVARFEQCVANECRSVCGVAGTAIPDARRASRIARWNDGSLRWWRRSMPLRGSTERRSAGNTYCQHYSCAAPLYFRSSACGSPTGRARRGDRARESARPRTTGRAAGGRDASEAHDPIPSRPWRLERGSHEGPEDVLDPRPDRFHDPQAGTVEELAKQSVRAVERAEERCDLLPDHDRQSHWQLGPGGAGQNWQLAPQHVAVEEEQGAPRLVLCRRCNVQIDRKVRQERVDVGSKQFRRMAIATERNTLRTVVQLRPNPSLSRTARGGAGAPSRWRSVRSRPVGLVR